MVTHWPSQKSSVTRLFWNWTSHSWSIHLWQFSAHFIVWLIISNSTFCSLSQINLTTFYWFFVLLESEHCPKDRKQTYFVTASLYKTSVVLFYRNVNLFRHFTSWFNSFQMPSFLLMFRNSIQSGIWHDSPGRLRYCFKLPLCFGFPGIFTKWIMFNIHATKNKEPFNIWYVQTCRIIWLADSDFTSQSKVNSGWAKKQLCVSVCGYHLSLGMLADWGRECQRRRGNFRQDLMYTFCDERDAG